MYALETNQEEAVMIQCGKKIFELNVLHNIRYQLHIWQKHHKEY